MGPLSKECAAQFRATCPQHRMLSLAARLRFWDLAGISGERGRSMKDLGPLGRLEVLADTQVN